MYYFEIFLFSLFKTIRSIWFLSQYLLCLRIQSKNVVALAYTPGYSGLAQSLPHETIPICSHFSSEPCKMIKHVYCIWNINEGSIIIVWFFWCDICLFYKPLPLKQEGPQNRLDMHLFPPFPFLQRRACYSLQDWVCIVDCIACLIWQLHWPTKKSIC